MKVSSTVVIMTALIIVLSVSSTSSMYRLRRDQADQVALTALLVERVKARKPAQPLKPCSETTTRISDFHSQSIQGVVDKGAQDQGLSGVGGSKGFKQAQRDYVRRLQDHPLRTMF
jgi:hypothetical protein